jgi:hypothetical protein
MIMRDQLVFRGCAAYGIPVVWNLAGGYQRDADDGINYAMPFESRHSVAAQIDCHGEDRFGSIAKGAS